MYFTICSLAARGFNELYVHVFVNGTMSLTSSYSWSSQRGNSIKYATQAAALSTR